MLARDAVLDTVRGLLGRFREGAESLYDEEARAARRMIGKDRDGNRREFPLLTASAVVVWLPVDRGDPTLEEVARQISEHKSQAKLDPSKLALVNMIARPPTHRAEVVISDRDPVI
ncbi:MAG: hypothetical protein WDO24_05435 [Pseudomonadota bacterium]